MTDKELLELYQKLMQEPISVPAFYAYYKEAYSEIKTLIDQVFNLTNYEDRESYEKLKDLLADRYAKLFAFAKYVAKKETPLYELPDNLIDQVFKQFGFTFDNLTVEDKRQIVQSIADIVKKKGSLSVIQDVLQTLLKYTKINLIELDLVKDSSGLWNLINPETGYRYLIQDINDNHWLTKLDNLKSPFQYRTPFFSFDSDAISVDDLTKVILFINKLVRDELEVYNETGSFPTSIYIEAFQISLSLTELWLWLISLYNAYIQVSTGDDTYLNPQPETVVVFDEDIVLTEETKHDVFYAVADIPNNQLKELTYKFYIDNFDRLDSVTYSEFDSYLAATWDDYYAYESEVRNAYIASAFFYMKLSKRKSYQFYIDELWDELTRLPKDYIEKYISCNENPEKGLLYVFYDIFTKSYNDNRSIVVSKIIRNAEGQLNIINPKLVSFKDKVVEAVQNGKISKDDFQLLVGYLLIKLSEYLFTTYVIHFPIDVFFGYALSYYTKQTLEQVISEIKPIYARFLFGNNVTKFKIDNKLLESIRYLLHDLLVLFQKLHDTESITDHIKNLFIFRFVDFINGLTHVYKFLDLNFIASYYNFYKDFRVLCCDADNQFCLSNLKVLKYNWWSKDTLCDNVCNWTNKPTNKLEFSDAVEAISKDYKCMHTYVFDGSIIPVLRKIFVDCSYNEGLYNICLYSSKEKPTALYVTLPSSNSTDAFTITLKGNSDTHPLNTKYFEEYPVLLDKVVHYYIPSQLFTLEDKPYYSVFDFVNRAYTDDLLRFIMSNTDVLNLIMKQLLQSDIPLNEKSLYQFFNAFKDLLQHINKLEETYSFRFKDNLSQVLETLYDVAIYGASRYNEPATNIYLLTILYASLRQLFRSDLHTNDQLKQHITTAFSDVKHTADSFDKTNMHITSNDTIRHNVSENLKTIRMQTKLLDRYAMHDQLTIQTEVIGKYDNTVYDSEGDTVHVYG